MNIAADFEITIGPASFTIPVSEQYCNAEIKASPFETYVMIHIASLDTANALNNALKETRGESVIGLSVFSAEYISEEIRRSLLLSETGFTGLAKTLLWNREEGFARFEFHRDKLKDEGDRLS